MKAQKRNFDEKPLVFRAIAPILCGHSLVAAHPSRKVSGLGTATDVRSRTWSTDSNIVELAAKTSLMLVCDVDAVFDMRV
ncbi:hypothetical protein [Paraburkholderia atlantica]|uniref:hypothetical protein n=1 Tax=Paraburkholderia atlantica TaxID=2654982 RepID=UPI0016156A08|nr:hypothetical protein [Paraburkholderia atlantica]MBB5414223.1 hypothetical protein [Paraburkholderia atlantica]